MADLKNKIQKEIDLIWPEAKKNISRVNKDVIRFVKKSEKNLIAAYDIAQQKTQQLLAKAKREELYYELGKSVAPLLTSDQLKNRNVLRISSEIRELSRKMRSKK
jgi:hypothetical protein